MHKPFNNKYIWCRVVLNPGCTLKSPGELLQSTATCVLRAGTVKAAPLGAGAERPFASQPSLSCCHRGGGTRDIAREWWVREEVASQRASKGERGLWLCCAKCSSCAWWAGSSSRRVLLGSVTTGWHSSLLTCFRLGTLEGQCSGPSLPS